MVETSTNKIIRERSTLAELEIIIRTPVKKMYWSTITLEYKIEKVREITILSKQV